MSTVQSLPQYSSESINDLDPSVILFDIFFDNFIRLYIMSVVNKVGNYGDGETDVDDLIHSWAKIPIMSADPDDENDQQGILLKRDIMTLYDDYANISKNAGASRNCIKLGIVERVSSDPTGYFDGLAAYALGNDDDLNIVDVLKACNVANGSLIDVSIIFQNWYCVIMGTDTPVAGGAGKNNIFKEPVGTMPSYLAKRPPALLCRYGTSDTDMESIPSAASSARQMDMSSVRSSDYQQHNFIVRKPSWEHLPACANVVRHNDFDPNDPTSMSLPPVDKTGLISPDSAFFRNILGDNAAEDAPMSPSSQVSSAVRMSISSKDMDDDEFYSNLEEITNIISYTSFDDYGGRYDTTSPRRKVNPSKNGGGVVESVPIVSDSEPASSSELEKAEAASGDKMAIGIAGNGKMEAPSIAIPTNNGTDGCSTSGSAVGSAAPNVQRRKRRKLMDIVEVLSDGTKVSKTILTPKGIYKTPHGFRVQLNIEPIIDESGNQSASAKRGKFSRNAKNFEDVSCGICGAMMIVVQACVLVAHSLVIKHCILGDVGIRSGDSCLRLPI